MLCSCNYVATDPDALLHPPMLNRQQEEIYAALEDVLVLSDIRYKYPQSGDYRTPFVFYDMDSDGLLEAIVFYSNQEDLSHTRTKILRQEQDGTWSNFHDFSIDCDQVGFVQFGHLLSTEASCMMIGWQNTNDPSSRSSSSVLGVYSLKDSRFSTEVANQRYIDYTLYDFNGDGLDEIVAIEQDPQTLLLHLSLLCAVGPHIDITDSMPLSATAMQSMHMTAGTLWDGSSAVFIDERLANGQWATEIVRIGENGMTLAVGYLPDADPVAENPVSDSYPLTFREQALPCGDYDGDGSIDVPGTEIPLLTSLDAEDSEPVSLTSFLQLTETGLNVTRYAAINSEEGYLLFFPEKWLGWVSVLRDEETGQWRFFLVDPDTADPTIELLRIQAYTESRDDLSAENGWIALGSRGTRQFAGYIPLTAEDTPYITEAELKTMFRILS